MSEPLTSKDLVVGGFYNWKGQPERLSYIGAQRYNGDSRTWHQFALVDVPGVCWCEVLDWQLNLFEVTERAAVQAAQPEAVGWKLVPVEPTEEMLEAARTCHKGRMYPQDDKHGPAAMRRREYVAMLASAPTPEPMSAPTEAKPAQQDAVDAEAGALSPEQEEWVMDLAQKHNLGRRVGQIGTLQGVAPDVFYTDASYRTQELFDFAAELLASSELNADQRRALVDNWFAEDWAVHKALGLLDDYDTERAAISAKKVGA